MLEKLRREFQRDKKDVEIKELHKYEEQVTKLQKIVKTHQGTIAEFRQQLNEKDRKIHSLKMDLSKKDDEIIHLKSDLESKSKELEYYWDKDIKKFGKEKTAEEHEITQKKSKKQKKVYYHFLEDDYAKSIGKSKGGFYLAHNDGNGQYEYYGRGIQTTHPEFYLQSFVLHLQGYTSKEIFERIPYFQKKYRTYSSLNKMLSDYDEDLFRFAIIFLVKNYDDFSDYIRLVKHLPIPILV